MTDQEIDATIIAALKNARRKGKLDVVAVVVGLESARLREIIMDPDAELTLFERMALKVHLT